MRHPRHGPPDGLPAHDDAGDLLESAALTPPKTLQWACFPSALQPITMRKVTPRRRPSMPNNTRELPAAGAAHLKFLHDKRRILPRNFKWISGTGIHDCLPVPVTFRSS